MAASNRSNKIKHDIMDEIPELGNPYTIIIIALNKTWKCCIANFLQPLASAWSDHLCQGLTWWQACLNNKLAMCHCVLWEAIIFCDTEKTFIWNSALKHLVINCLVDIIAFISVKSIQLDNHLICRMDLQLYTMFVSEYHCLIPYIHTYIHTHTYIYMHPIEQATLHWCSIMQFYIFSLPPIVSSDQP